MCTTKKRTKNGISFNFSSTYLFSVNFLRNLITIRGLTIFAVKFGAAPQTPRWREWPQHLRAEY